MRLLLDAHLLVWAMASPERLAAEVRAMLEYPLNTPVFSVASLWELVIKSALGPSKRSMRWPWLTYRRCIGIHLIGCCWRRPVPRGCC